MLIQCAIPSNWYEVWESTFECAFPVDFNFFARPNEKKMQTYAPYPQIIYQTKIFSAFSNSFILFLVLIHTLKVLRPNIPLHYRFYPAAEIYRLPHKISSKFQSEFRHQLFKVDISLKLHDFVNFFKLSWFVRPLESYVS